MMAEERKNIDFWPNEILSEGEGSGPLQVPRKIRSYRRNPDVRGKETGEKYLEEGYRK